MDELAIPEGLHNKILQSTIGTAEAKAVKASWASQFGEMLRGLKFPISVPQFAPVAMMLIFAFLVFSKTVSADGTLSGIYQKSYELAGQTYQQSADAVFGEAEKPNMQKSNQKPIDGKFVNDEENK